MLLLVISFTFLADLCQAFGSYTRMPELTIVGRELQLFCSGLSNHNYSYLYRPVQVDRASYYMHSSAYRLHECKTCRNIFDLLTYGVVSLPAFFGSFPPSFSLSSYHTVTIVLTTPDVFYLVRQVDSIDTRLVSPSLSGIRSKIYPTYTNQCSYSSSRLGRFSLQDFHTGGFVNVRAWNESTQSEVTRAYHHYSL